MMLCGIHFLDKTKKVYPSGDTFPLKKLICITTDDLAGDLTFFRIVNKMAGSYFV